MASNLLPEMVTAVKQSYKADKVKYLLDRLLLLQGVIEENVDQPIIAHYPFAAKVDGVPINHLHGGLITQPGLVYDTPKAAGIATRHGVFSTLYNNRLEQGYSNSGQIPLLLGSLLFFHINGDNSEDRGFFIGDSACQNFLESLPGEQAGFIGAAIL